MICPEHHILAVDCRCPVSDDLIELSGKQMSDNIDIEEADRVALMLHEKFKKGQILTMSGSTGQIWKGDLSSQIKEKKKDYTPIGPKAQSDGKDTGSRARPNHDTERKASSIRRLLRPNPSYHRPNTKSVASSSLEPDSSALSPRHNHRVNRHLTYVCLIANLF